MNTADSFGMIIYSVACTLGLIISICWIIFPFRVIKRMDKQLDLLQLIAVKLSQHR